jgi:hypothetical protein
MRETLYEELSTLVRANLHRDIAEAIEETEATRLQSFFPQLAHYYFEASRSGQAPKALEYCSAAAQYSSRWLRMSLPVSTAWLFRHCI